MRRRTKPRTFSREPGTTRARRLDPSAYHKQPSAIFGSTSSLKGGVPPRFSPTLPPTSSPAAPPSPEPFRAPSLPPPSGAPGGSPDGSQGEPERGSGREKSYRVPRRLEAVPGGNRGPDRGGERGRRRGFGFLNQTSILAWGTSLVRSAGALETGRPELDLEAGGARGVTLSPLSGPLEERNPFSFKGLACVEGPLVDIMQVIGRDPDIVGNTALFLPYSLSIGGESAPILSDFVSFARAGALELDLEGAGAASLPGPPEGQAGALRRFRKIKNDPGFPFSGARARA